MYLLPIRFTNRLICTAVLLAGSVSICAGILLSAELQPQENTGMIAFKAIKMEGKEQVEVTFSDIRFVATELYFVHENGSKTHVTASGGNIELKTGGLITSGKKTEINYPNGLLSLRGLTAR